jgi:hypothetical protein
MYIVIQGSACTKHNIIIMYNILYYILYRSVYSVENDKKEAGQTKKNEQATLETYCHLNSKIHRFHKSSKQSGDCLDSRCSSGDLNSYVTN